MNKKSIRMLVLTIALLVVSGIFTACGSSNNQGNAASSELSGSITAAGSTALQPLAEQAAQSFKAKNPDAEVDVQGGGSGTGLSQVMQGTVEIGNSDISASDKTGIDASQLVDHKVCVVGFAVAANKNVKVDNLTKAQLIGIFTGKITNWKQVGGDDVKIVVINRPKSSGTRATFKKYALDGNEETEGMALTQDSSGAVKTAIASNNGAIGYLAVPYITDEVKKEIKTIKLDGVEASRDNITSGKYQVWSYEHMYSKGEAQGLTKAFLDYMQSSEVEPLIVELGYIPMSNMKVSR